MGQLELFTERLPKKPYCTDVLEYGVRVRAAQDAIKRKYIQPNFPWLKTWLVYDIDRPGAAHDWQWIDSCPAPNIIVENPVNQHAHLFYGLEIPIAVDDYKFSKAAKYGAAIQYALMKKLGADPGYRGLLSKNPLHEYWNVSVREQFLYTLDWLADYLDLERFDARQRAEDYGIGRNCTLFNIVRKYAYGAVRDYWHDRKDGYQAFYDDLQVKAVFSNNNEFGADNCLFYPEVSHIIKSVSKWTWKHFTPADFAERQQKRSRLAAKKRTAAAEIKRQSLLVFMNERPDASIRDLSKLTGYPIGTVHRLKRGAISDMGDGTP